jgi:hypothetical protein
MLKRGDVVFLDSTAIFEAHRTGIWKQLMGGFQLATVEKCIEEAETGNLAGNPNQVDTMELRKKMSVHRVDEKAVVDAMVDSNYQLATLDEGEKELLACAHGHDGAWFLSSQDKACLRVGTRLGMIERFISLEEMANVAGIRPRVPFRVHFTRRWLSEERTKCRLGVI